jgi:hypothetical protein
MTSLILWTDSSVGLRNDLLVAVFFWLSSGVRLILAAIVLSHGQD